MTAVDDLARRLDLLEAERAVLARLHAYAHTLDYGDAEGWVDCFCEDGAFDVRGRGGSGAGSRVVAGRDELRAFVRYFSRPPEGYHKHCLVEPMISVEGDSASATSYLFLLHDVEDAPRLQVFGRYRDRLRREGDGAWRFELRIAEIESVAPGFTTLADVRRPGHGGADDG